jgi:hypothetical protein
MNILLTIDDTDNLESAGTGELCETIAASIEEKGWGTCSGVTRHQLFIHEDIPYTSHNSSMCFRANIHKDHLEPIIAFASNFLETESAEGSDPGLCVVNEEALQAPQKLIAFGEKAKKKVLTKADAYGLAKELSIHLSEHGGTGDGVIGALAGTGLRLTGNDGRFKGHHQIPISTDPTTVKELLDHPRIDRVEELHGEALPLNTAVSLSNKVKTVLLDHDSVLLLYQDPKDQLWKNCTKQHLKGF